MRDRTRGTTLPELLVVLTVLSTLAALGWSGVSALREASALGAAARQVSAQLTLARRLAVGRRERIRFGRGPDALVITDPAGRVLARLNLSRPDGLPVDSVRIRPSSLRFNARGHAAPGSVYLYRGRRSVRIVCNFLGRLRIEPVRRAS